MDKVPEKLVHISKRDIKKLFRLATEYCQWDEYEKGDKYRDNKTSLGLKEFLEQNLNTKVQSRNKLKVHYNQLHKAIRNVIDESYLFYYNINGTFKVKKAKVEERNKFADSLSGKFVNSLT